MSERTKEMIAKVVLIAMIVLANALLPCSLRAASVDSGSQKSFYVYLPHWLPIGFKPIYDPTRSQYPRTSGNYFTRRYGAQGRWLEVFEGPAGCCLDSLPSHRVGATRLTGGKVGYFSDQRNRFGGRYLFWDQGRTYIAINSPSLSKNVLIRIANSVSVGVGTASRS